MSAVHYLVEIRKRLLQWLMLVALFFFIFSFEANPLYSLLAQPLLHQLPAESGLLATQVGSTFLVPFKFALIVAFFASIPYLLWHLWRFLMPALYPDERKNIWLLLVLSSGLFYLGVMFAYVVVFPLMFRFLVQMAPIGVEFRPDISHYLDFSMSMFFAFGVAFEVPIITWLVVKLGIFSRDQLKNARPYVIVAAFVLGMVLTPPDVVSQILLAVPIWALFELGLLLLILT